MLVHGLMWLAVGVCVALGNFLKPSRGMQIVGGMALSCALVLEIWSLLLAIRALWARERKIWPLGVLAVGLIEITIISALLLFGAYNYYADWRSHYGIVVIAPVVAIASIISIPLAMWRARRAESRSADVWTKTRRWKRGAVWFVLLMLPLLSIALPVPLFIHALRLQSHDGRLLEGSLPRFALEHTPIFVGDAVAEHYSTATAWSDMAVYCVALDSGRVSHERLLNEIHNTKFNNASAALSGLQKRYSVEALELAEKIGIQSKTLGAGGSLEMTAGILIAQFGSAEQVRRMLATGPAASAPTASMCAMTQAMAWVKRPEFCLN